MQDLSFNDNPAFTKWALSHGYLREPFVVLDVGVQGGANPRWDALGDHLVFHGFDAIAEVVEDLEKTNAGRPNRYFHNIAVGQTDGEQAFYFNAANPTASSMYAQGASRFDISAAEQVRNVTVRRLDTLLAAGQIPKGDFLKVDVEGFEKDVFLGARQFLESGVLGIETETSFSVSPAYPKSHLGTLCELLLQHHFRVFDIGYDRIVRASFRRALATMGYTAMPEHLGRPATLNVLLCRDPIEETDQPQNYPTRAKPLDVDQLIKMMIIFELHGLNDVAVDIAERFAEQLKSRLDAEAAIRHLATPYCRPEANALFQRINDMERSTSWRITFPMRAVRTWISRR